jgi:hypothetical protein
LLVGFFFGPATLRSVSFLRRKLGKQMTPIGVFFARTQLDWSKKHWLAAQFPIGREIEMAGFP